MTIDVDTYISLPDDTEIDVTVTADYTPGDPGRWYLANGDPGYPPEPAEVEVTDIVDGDGKSYEYDDLSESNRERIDDLIYRAAQSPD